jgi:hypothetical protein
MVEARIKGLLGLNKKLEDLSTREDA